MREGHSRTGSVVTALAGTLTMTALVMTGVVHLAIQAMESGADPGDIVSFTPGAPLPSDLAGLVAARIDGPAEGACMLDLAVIARSGGSFVIEARDGQAYRMHLSHALGGAADERGRRRLRPSARHRAWAGRYRPAGAGRRRLRHRGPACAGQRHAHGEFGSLRRAPLSGGLLL